MKWRTWHPAARVIVVLVGAFVVFNLALGLLDSFTSEADRSRVESDPASTRPDGTSAWVELLRRNDVAVQTGASSISLDAASTAVVLEPLEDTDEVSALIAFVADGGNLVADPTTSTIVVSALSDDSPVWSRDTSNRAVSVADVPETEGVSDVVTAGVGSWEDPAPLQAILARPDDLAVVAAGYPDGEAGGDAGRVVALADVSIVQNRTIGEADNAAFAINLADGRPVAFVTDAAGAPTGLAAIPGRWWIALVGGVLAFLLGAIAVGRRIGPPDRQRADPHPPRHAFADSVGLTLERTRDPDALVPLQRHLRDGLARRGGLAVGATDDEVRAVARRLEWPQDEIDAIFAPADASTMLMLGDALARLTTSDNPHPRVEPHPPVKEGLMTQRGSTR